MICIPVVNVEKPNIVFDLAAYDYAFERMILK